MEIWQLTIQRSEVRQDSDQTSKKNTFILSDCFESLKYKFMLSDYFESLVLESKERREDRETVFWVRGSMIVK